MHALFCYPNKIEKVLKAKINGHAWYNRVMKINKAAFV